MSIKLMNAVFDRYPNGGGEFTLALALADHAHDDGSHIFPTVPTLAQKTRQSERAVQYQLRKMEDLRWLLLVGPGDGGSGRAREYRINPEWIKGAEIAPSNKGEPAAPRGAMVAPGGVQNDAEKGAMVAPAIEPQEPSGNTSPLPPSGARGLEAANAEPFHLTPQSSGPSGSASGRKPRPHPIELQTWLDECKAAGVRAIPPDDEVFAYCERVGIPREVLELHWREFKRRRLASKKRQKSWEQTFRNSVEGNWYRLWMLTGDGRCELTTVGRQAKADHEAHALGGKAA